ncbi:major facilitator superfamily domain-containing protein 8 [Anthonomus grandis grandis]|uniref:major facilitator superfamily domain-containing protein 8 n=1 Tax=Anthonomus grandis grandis TaxID=2921223 RepID=UPI002165E90C|nr:major facilitator superfamily domain-containing protein 8 [Anthonomus grandis grandis]XP_050313325.1 major facilitator superfamily domain-containing protein 8 [Anthonomus grandis grandis]XP_050313326.1 major facilitator superfamily domain-containing protein 8 [Anthonomus grandis grandis]XP_050313327.1 major facilitator superfamily domain-containing protein 8 [Anthonomus grandis grandis]
MPWLTKIRKLFKSMNNAELNIDENLETPLQYKERWRSIYVIYFTIFIMSLGFSIVVTGVWPYLDKLDPLAGKEFMGFIVAANPFGQMLFSPLVGWWSNKLGSIRIPLIFSLLLFTIASAIYSCLELFDDHIKHWMLWSRFLVGVSSASVAACRSYLSAATRYSERTKAVSMISLAQVLGFVVGPAIQAAVVPLGDKGVWLVPNKLKLNMYTATGWINVFLAIINVCLFLPKVFQEHKIAAKEAMFNQGKESEKEALKVLKPDYFAAWTLIVAFFVMVFNFMLLETLGTPLTMDQLGWSKDKSLSYMGILMSICAFLSILTFPSIPILSKKFSEVKLMIWIGFLLMVIGRLTCIPFNEPPPKVFDVNLKINLSRFCEQQIKNSSLSYDLDYNSLNISLRQYDRVLLTNVTSEKELRNMTLDCGDDLLGCPSNQEWCYYTPAISYTQFIVCYVLTVLGYPIGVTLIQTLFSKVLGARPQGVWMGLITGAGCLSRVMGPIFVTHVYEEYGTVWTFGMTSVMMAISLVWLWYFDKRLEPKDPTVQKNPDKEETLKEQEMQELVCLKGSEKDSEAKQAAFENEDVS